MAHNCNDPNLLDIWDYQERITLTIPRTDIRTFFPFTAYKLNLNLPGVDGGSAQGVCIRGRNYSTDPNTRVITLVTKGVAVISVRNQTNIPINVDDPVSLSANGVAMLATGSAFVFGRALDSSDGTGFFDPAPGYTEHFIRVKIIN